MGIDPVSVLTLLFLLIAAHCLCDYPLQTQSMVDGKNSVTSESKGHFDVPWYYWLWAHAFIHALAVYIITRSITLALTELTLHFGIDYLKCIKVTNIHVDQFLHILCKIVYVVLIFAGMQLL